VRQVSYGQYMCSNHETERNTLLNIKNEYNDVLTKVDEASKKFNVEVFYRRFGENLGLSSDNCRFPFDWCFLNPSGDITPCCYLGDNVMGNVFDNSFESIWFGKKMQKLRKSRFLPSCSFCAPFQSFDSPHSHFTAMYNLTKQTDEYI
jgi:MoaA/NifB/PqqE/SkfB family radical SAM enzyme